MHMFKYYDILLFKTKQNKTAPQIRQVSRRHCALYKLNLLTYLLNNKII